MKKCKINYEHLDNAITIRRLITNHFDNLFWECELKEGLVEESLENSEYILFTIQDKPCAFVKMTHEPDQDDSEIELIEVEESFVGRSNGIGERIVNLLKNTLYIDRNLYGYSTPRASRFWKRNSQYYDERIYDKMASCDFESGGLMFFTL